MRKTTVGLAMLATLALAAPAAAGEAIVVVEDPTPSGSFSGEYVESCRTHRPSPKDKKCTEGTQDGYVAVYEDGVVVCNGSTDYAPYDQDGDGANDAIQGYAWVGSGQEATGDKVFETPGGEAGAGSNHGKLSHEPTGEPPCPEADPEGDGAGR